MLQRKHWDRLGNGGLNFTTLGFGSAPLGNLYRAISDDDAHAVLEAAWAGGVRHYDTAPLYGYGLAETRLNRFLRGKPREDYVLTSKVGRLLRVADAATRDGIGKWFDIPARIGVYDYSYDVPGSTFFTRMILTCSAMDQRPRCRRGWMSSWWAAIARFWNCAIRV
jgi:D-threo-aldose 1-dehydrogenase